MGTAATLMGTALTILDLTVGLFCKYAPDSMPVDNNLKHRRRAHRNGRRAHISRRDDHKIGRRAHTLCWKSLFLIVNSSSRDL